MCKRDREREEADQGRLRLLPVTSLHNSRAPSTEIPALRLRRRLPRASQVIEREGEGARGPDGRAHARARVLHARGARDAAVATRRASGVSEERDGGTHGRGRKAGMSHTEK